MTRGPAALPTQSTRRAAAAALPVAFVGLGATGAIIPSVLPSYAAMHSENPEGAFLAVPLLFAGLLGGVVLAAATSSRINLARVVGLGAGIQVAALLLIAVAPGATGLLPGAAFAGLGFGLVESAGVAAARETHGDSAGRVLTRLTALVAITAMAVPLLVVATVGPGGLRAVVALCAVPHLLAVVAMFRIPFYAPAPRPDPVLHARHRPSETRPGRLRLLAPAISLFFYVGAESILAGWSSEFPRQLGAIDPAVAALGTSAFWGLLWLGRTLALRLLDHGMGERRLVLGAQTLAVALLAASAASAHGHAPAGTLLLAAAVPALAPSYGLLLNAGMRLAVVATARTSATLVAVGALGGSALTLVASQIRATAGADAVPWTLALAAAALALALAAAARSTQNASPQ